MDNLKHQKYKNKQLKNSTLELQFVFELTNISINDMLKKNTKEENIYKKTLV